VAAVNAALVWLFDAAAAWAIRVAPLTTLVVLSVVTGLALLWLAGRVTNQDGVAAAKRGIYAALFEVRLFNDDLGAVLRRESGRCTATLIRVLGDVDASPELDLATLEVVLPRDGRESRKTRDDRKLKTQGD